MASVTEGTIPRSKIRMYAEDDLGLVGEELDFFIAVIRRVEAKSKAPVVADPAMTDHANDVDGVKKIIKRVAKPAVGDNSFHGKKPKVRHPRS